MNDVISLPVTSVAAFLNGVLFFLLTLSVIRMRRADKIVLGDGENRDMAKRIRGQANAAEQMPIFLILLALAELSGAGCWVLAAIAGLFTLGRLAHALYFSRPGTHWRFRAWGMAATLLGQLAILVVLGLGQLG